ncbi:MAG: hypothetical protein PVG90_12870 [Bacillota bacterium]|jgi:YesN/AraC family two-component response regulator
MWRAILVEDEECAGAELARLFPWHYFQFELIDEAENMQEVKALIATTQPDLVIIDIRVPETEGLYYHFKIQMGKTMIKENRSEDRLVLH